MLARLRFARRSRQQGAALLLFASTATLISCQQLLGLDDPTVSLAAVGRVCECLPLLEQGLQFAGAEGAACETALGEQPAELLLTLAANGCTDCDNVKDCYADLTAAAAEDQACGLSNDCASWACCAGELTVQFAAVNGDFEPQLVSEPDESICCTSCSSCDDALLQLNRGAGVVACAEAEQPLSDLLVCVRTDFSGCGCSPVNVAPECIECLINLAKDEGRCTAEFQACTNIDRPIEVDE